MTKSARTADLVTFTEEILNRKVHFCAVVGAKFSNFSRPAFSEFSYRTTVFIGTTLLNAI